MTDAHVEGATAPYSQYEPRPCTKGDLMEHYYLGLGDGVWFKNAYDMILDELPIDRPSHFVEVGVLYGQSLAYLGVEVLNRQLPVTIHAVDNFAGWPGVDQGDVLREKFLRNTKPVRDAMPFHVDNNVYVGEGQHMHQGFVVHAKDSLAAAAEFPDASLAVVWLDADHSYEAVKGDIAAWWPKVRMGGYLGGDDWAFRGVRMAVSEAFPQGYLLGDGERFQAPWPWWLAKREA